MVITPEYKELLIKEHKKFINWGAHAGKYKPTKINEVAIPKNVKTILDYGCGKGSLKQYMNEMYPNYLITEYDPGIEGKDTPPESADMVVCFDVLEHVEYECVDAVIKDLRRLTKTVLMADVCSVPAGKILLDGRNSHLIQEHGDWWVSKFTKYFDFEYKSSWDKGLVAVMVPKGTV